METMLKQFAKTGVEKLKEQASNASCIDIWIPDTEENRALAFAFHTDTQEECFENEEVTLQFQRGKILVNDYIYAWAIEKLLAK